MPMVRDYLLSYSYHKINKLFEYFNYLDNRIKLMVLMVFGRDGNSMQVTATAEM